ncbi:MAG: gliding motility-associated C-terminal domain-containing protein [Saprospiraceae bacterium]
MTFPNIFNPNSINNNTFYGTTATNRINLHRITIYDRWGNIMYEKLNIQLSDPSVGWDGKTKGIPCEQGVYVWTAEVILPDGSRQLLSGDVTLVR